MGSQYRHRRTSDPAQAFPGLEPGEIAVNTSNRQLAVGDANGATIGQPIILLGIRLYDTRAQYATGELMVRSGIIYRALVDVAPGTFTPAQWEAISGTINPNYVQKAGDTMTGLLTLSGDPTAAMHAVTKQYSDTKLAKAGGTMTGNLTLAGDPSAPAMAATKSYVDAAVAAKAAVFISDTPPPGVPDNSLWWESDTGLLFVRYNDGDSTQWVLAMPMPDVSQFVQKAGDTMTGPLVLSGDPTAVLHAAPKQYVDAGDAATLTSAGNLINARAVRYDAAQGLTAAQQLQARQNVNAAAFDAMAFNGLQINGAMDVSQQNVGNWVALGGGTYLTDQWLVGFERVGSTMNGAQYAVGVPGIPYSLALQAATALPAGFAASNYVLMQQRIEGTRCRRLGWGTASAQPIVVSFWLWSQNVSGTFTAQLRNSAATRSYLKDLAVSSALGWTFYQFTVPGDTTGTWATDTSAGLVFQLCFGAGSNWTGVEGWNASSAMATANTSQTFFAAAGNTIFMTGLHIVPGNDGPSSLRLPFVQRPFDQELALCMRYWEKSYPYSSPPGSITNVGARGSLQNQGPSSYSPGWMVRKRVAPTVTIYSPATGATGNGADNIDRPMAASNIGESGFSVINSFGIATQPILYHFVADARM
ncbi:hypothetical protein ABIG06_006259 [Bradyrhizobium sp. USDA 326]|uniref:hypothetical protein n=1 Tax=unclassified Bradyrhizobium TaxID=2631580 RepID=UPI0035156951